MKWPSGETTEETEEPRDVRFPCGRSINHGRLHAYVFQLMKTERQKKKRSKREREKLR